VLLALALAACAAPPAGEDGVLPGSIGVAVTPASSGVVISALREGRRGELRVGDVVLSYNGQAIADPRQFYRLVTDSRPGSLARLEVLREGARRVVEVPVVELDTSPRS
jgi:serine protease Do